MSAQGEWNNKLYFGDNLQVLREHVPDESVDLIYLDPPFNSNATYNVLFGEKNGSNSQAQITAFDDTWHWSQEAEKTYHEIVTDGPKKLADLVQALRSFLGQNDMMAYLVMMAARLEELHRVLKSTGSLYLHCDPTASHYLKLLLDAIFDPRHFRNEIVWRRANGHNKTSKQYGPIHDTILFYSKTDSFHFEPGRTPYSKVSIQRKFTYSDERGLFRLNELTGPGTRTGDSGKQWRGYDPTTIGRHWAIPQSLKDRLPQHGATLSVQEMLETLHEKGDIRFTDGGRPEYKQRMGIGVPYQDIWAYQPGTAGSLIDPGTEIDEDVKWLGTDKERLGFPTQKPVGLLNRIISSSSVPGGLVLDPFCGCGTTINAAEFLHRRWIGIDITHLAIALIKNRLADTFKSELSPYEVIGAPRDLASAEALAAQDKYQFEWWALSLVDARPAQDKKKGADSGIDGYIYFFDDESGTAKKIIVQVKGGHVTVSQIRDLRAVVDREKAVIGAFITLESPTKPMTQEALSAGFYEPEFLTKDHHAPKIQIFTIAELLSGATIKYPRLAVTTFKRAERKQKVGGPKQTGFF